MRTIDGEKTDKHKQYVLANEAIAIERELIALRQELTAKNNFPAMCTVIEHIPGAVQSLVFWQSRMDEKRISKMSGVWDTGIERTMEYRVVLWSAKGKCCDRTHKSLRTALQQCCDELGLKFPEELE